MGMSNVIANRNDCGPRESCNPTGMAPAANQPWPGICLPGDDCVAAYADNICPGEEPASCSIFENITIGREAGDAAEGEACGPNPMDPSCASGLSCFLNKCAAG